MYAFTELVLFMCAECQDFLIDIVQHRKLIIMYGV